jgi:hypothetical protein
LQDVQHNTGSHRALPALSSIRYALPPSVETARTSPRLTKAGSISTIYWPVTYPSATYPWILGEKNLLYWQTGGGSGIDSFDIQLHNNNKTILNGFIPIALRVPLERLPTGRKNFGGEMEVDLDPNVMPTG